MKTKLPLISPAALQAIGMVCLGGLSAEEEYETDLIRRINERMMQLATDIGVFRNFCFTVEVEGDASALKERLCQYFRDCGWHQAEITELRVMNRLKLVVGQSTQLPTATYTHFTFRLQAHDEQPFRLRD